MSLPEKRQPLQSKRSESDSIRRQWNGEVKKEKGHDCRIYLGVMGSSPFIANAMLLRIFDALCISRCTTTNTMFNP
jgi:hypothetical protein